MLFLGQLGFLAPYYLNHSKENDHVKDDQMSSFTAVTVGL